MNTANNASSAPISADALSAGLLLGQDGQMRCSWAGQDSLYQAYHDTEWGQPKTDDLQIFETLCLEGFQAGLSWLTILRKRDAFRAAFAGFDFYRLAEENEKALLPVLLQNSGIIRHRAKIASVFGNARAAVKLVAEYGSFVTYLRQFAPEPDTATAECDRCEDSVLRQAVTQTPASARMAKDLRKRGFRFIGSTTAYAFMQAVGMVNDHVKGCCRHNQAESAENPFK